MKEFSCGFLMIDKNTGKMLACHPTGRPWKPGNFDIAKGHLENGETEIQTALRELNEETGIVIPKNVEIMDHGKFNYTKKKNLYVFSAVMDINPSKLRCSTKCINYKGQEIYEVDSYTLTDDISLFYKSLQPIIEEILLDRQKSIQET